MKRVNFTKIVNFVNKIFSNGAGDIYELLPDEIDKIAQKNSIFLRWEKQHWWNEFEYGMKDYDDEFIISQIFRIGLPEGEMLLVTDECFEEKKGLVFNFEEREKFISDYEDKFDCTFFQPQDYIFVSPHSQRISILQHDGYVKDYGALK